MRTTLLLLPCLLPLLQDTPGWGRRLQWKQGPPAREHAAFVPDPDRGRAVMLAGSGYRPYGDPLDDAWAYDLAQETWSELSVEGDPLTPGGSRRAAPSATGTYLHGGYGAGFSEVGELWHVTFEDSSVVVEEIPQLDSPPARFLHAFAADRETGRFVVFGGVGGDDAFDDTWIGTRGEDSVSWRQLELVSAADGGSTPGKRFGFAFAHDVDQGRLLVCGGQVPPEDGREEMIVAHDLWSLDFTSESPTWTRIAEYEPQAFPGRRNPAFAFDEATGDLFVWGGTGDGRSALPDLYVVRTRAEGAPVERIAQGEGISTRASGFGVLDPARGRVLLGFGNTGQGPFDDLVEVLLRGAPARD